MGYTPKTRVIIHGSTLGILMITLILLGQNDLAQGIRLQEKGMNRHVRVQQHLIFHEQLLGIPSRPENTTFRSRDRNQRDRYSPDKVAKATPPNVLETPIINILTSATTATTKGIIVDVLSGFFMGGIPNASL
ncbi:hypothetical protein TCAL_16294, partial [Tigriopus californicus]